MEIHKILSKKHFAELSKEVHEVIKAESWWQKHGHEFLVFFLRLALFAAGFFVFAQVGWVYKIVGMAVLTYAFYGIGITGTHETRHSSFTEKEKWNRLWAYFFSDFWAGQSNLWWYHRHVATHHVYTNVPDKEPKEFYYPWLNKYIYFFVVPYLVTLWLFFKSLRFLWGKWGKVALFLIFQTAGWIFHIALFALVLPWSQAVLATFVMRSLLAPVFVHIAVFNHIGLEDPLKRLPWLPHQSRTTRNLRPNWFLNGMGGSAFIECHVEHHLFPKVSNRLLHKIRPVVKKYLKKEGYKYYEEGYIACLKNCLKHYQTIFLGNPIEVVDL